MNGDEWNESPFLARGPGEIGMRAEVGECTVERRDAEERTIARMRAPHRERPPDGAIEPTLPRDALEDEGRDRDTSPAFARDDEERGRRSADRGQRRRDRIDIHPTERRVANVDDDEAEALAAERRGRRERETCAMCTYHDDALEIHVRTLRGKRIERGRRIDPGSHPTLRLRGGRRTECELKLSHAWWTDERDGLAGD